MSKFSIKINRLLKKQETGYNYLSRLKNPRLTEGFYNKVGDEFNEMLYDLQTNHTQEWQDWCDKQGFVYNTTTMDWFCS